MKNSALENHLLSRDKAKVLSQNYMDNNYRIINEHRNEPDSNEYYYSLETIEAYIAYIRERAAALGLNDVGLTLKMGQYPKQEVIDPRQRENYRGFQVVFLSANKTGADGSRVDVDELEALDFANICPPNY